MHAPPLEGIKILDLSRLLPGPLCTLHLAGLGAEVVKIEEPGTGDYSRAIPPLTKNISTFFLAVNRNKKSVTLDLKKPEGREILLKMVESAHVVVESFRPGTLGKMNLSYEVLAKHNPGIILCSITGYGQTGPYRAKAGHDLNYLAYAGILRPAEGTDGKPAIPNFQIGDIVGGTQNAAMGILAAIIQQTSTGKGQHLDVAMLDGLLAHNFVALAQNESVSSIGMDTSGILTGLLHCYNLYKTKDDKYIALGALEFKVWAMFCESINRDDLVSKHMVVGKESEQVCAELDRIFASKTRDEWVDELDGADCCIAPVNTLGEALHDPQVEHRELVKFHEHREEGGVTYFDLPFKSSAMPPPENTGAPLLGEHTEEILKGLGYEPQYIDGLRESGTI
jgi:crotonobetainyl-CoA:carnitine CoA-transferase CaiB-like acyl-CoA transferase